MNSRNYSCYLDLCFVKIVQNVLWNLNYWYFRTINPLEYEKIAVPYDSPDSCCSVGAG